MGAKAIVHDGGVYDGGQGAVTVLAIASSRNNSGGGVVVVVMVAVVAVVALSSGSTDRTGRALSTSTNVWRSSTGNSASMGSRKRRTGDEVRVRVTALALALALANL